MARTNGTPAGRKYMNSSMEGRRVWSGDHLCSSKPIGTGNQEAEHVQIRTGVLYVLKILTLKNFDGSTSCMPSSPKEYISP